METSDKKKQLLKEADILDMFAKVVSQWKFVAVVTGCFIIFGLVVAIGSVKDYTAEVVVAPETSSSSQLGAGLGSLANMFGVNMNTVTDEDAIYPELYPDIIQSLPFLSSLFNVNVVSPKNDIDTTYFYYITNQQKLSWFEHIQKWIADTKDDFMVWTGLSKVDSCIAVFNPYQLSKKQMGAVDKLNGKIGIFVDKKTNVITLSFTDRDPLIAAIMADTIMSRLQQNITEYRTRKSIADCEYIQNMYDEAKREYDTAQEKYAIYCDRNQNVYLERYLVEKERLETDKEMRYQLYLQWAQQLQLAKAKVQEYTPAFTTLKPAAVPALPSSMRRLYILAIYAFLGLICSVSYILFKDKIKNVFRTIITYNKK
ncbi:MAG: chain-length determining protein [Bacteroidaceae bacterium]|nr:chain-length determining protein [Bacteroidaceae bacterium]